MALTWTSISVGNALKYSHYNEVVINADNTADAIGIPHYNWTENVSKGIIVKEDHFQELRDAVDYLDNNNVCSTEHNNYNVSIDVDYKGSVENDENTGVDNNYQAGVDNSLYTNVDSNDNGNVFNGDDSGYNTDYDSGVDSNDNSGVDSNDNSGVDSVDDSGVDSNDNNTIYNGVNYSDNYQNNINDDEVFRASIYHGNDSPIYSYEYSAQNYGDKIVVDNIKNINVY